MKVLLLRNKETATKENMLRRKFARLQGVNRLASETRMYSICKDDLLIKS